MGGFVFFWAVVLFSLAFHEFGHAYVAHKFGDDTAKEQGRLSLNPVVHLDLFGSVLVPIYLFWFTGMAFGWAKPVPVKFENLKPQKLGTFCVAMAGVAINFAIALAAAAIIRAQGGFDQTNPLHTVLFVLVWANVLLGVFNLLPIPPLDGSKLWLMWLPFQLWMSIERHALWFFILLIMFLNKIPILPWVMQLVKVLVGIHNPSISA